MPPCAGSNPAAPASQPSIFGPTVPRPRSISLSGRPFPHRLRPHCHAREREEAGRFVFDVPITIPWLGFVIRYTGHMERRHV
ncbi:MAG: DUF4166 domain-containing protein [Sphingobium sp.]